MKLELSKQETACMKGIAILCIILHNFLHLLPFTVHECEYTFNLNKSYHLWANMTKMVPTLWADFISYYGHYGVPVFLFISGYGLVRKYESASAPQGVWKFVKDNVSKLFKLMIIAYILYLLIAKWGQGVDSLTAVAMLTFTGNLFDPPIADPGPYWYFSLTLQLYLLYYLLFRRTGKIVMIVVVVACCLLQAFYIDDYNSLRYIRYNFMGSVLPFCMGIWFSRYGVNIKKWYILPSLVIIALLTFSFKWMFGSFSIATIRVTAGIEWLFIPPFIVLTFVCLVKLLPKLLYSVFLHVGVISAAIFATHPIVRSQILPHTTRDNYISMVLLYLAICLLAGYVYSWVVKLLK